MKKILLMLLILSSRMLTMAQDEGENIFLDRSFWQNNPSVDSVKQKISQGHDPTEQDLFGFDAVSYGIIDDAPFETLKFLLSIEGNPVTKPTHGDLTYLLWAAYKGNIPMVKHLIELGSDVKFKTARGTNILLMSGFGGQQDTVLYDLMFSQGVDPNSSSSSQMNILLALAGSDADKEDIFKYLIKKGLDWNHEDENGNGFFHYAAKAGNQANMNLAIRRNLQFGSLNKKGENAMFYATYGRRRSEVLLETFMFLDSLGLEADIVNWKGQTPLHHAVKRGNAEVIDFFIEKGVNINQVDEDGNTAFMNAVFGKLENVQKLLPLVKNPNQINHKGYSALTNAVIYARKDAFNLLVEQGAELTIHDKNENDLISLIFQNFSERRKEDFEYILNELIANEISVKPIYADGNSLYHYAIEKNSPLLIQKAIELNVDPNHKNNLGLTPLHLAAMKATNGEIIEMLINAGADKNILTDFEESPHELATQNEILKSNKIDISSLQR